MKIYKTEKVDRKYLDKIICDWCKEEFKSEMDFNNTYPSSFADNEFTLTHKTGETYPEGGSGEELNIDLCYKCRLKLIELLKKEGITIKYKDWDW